MSARLKLTVIYAAALLITLIAIGYAVQMARTDSVYADAGQTARKNAQLVNDVIRLAGADRPSLLETDSAGRSVLLRSIKDQLEILPGYVVVLDRKADVQFTSLDVRWLSADDWQTMKQGIDRLPDNGPAGAIRLSIGKIVLYALPVSDMPGGANSGLSRVVAGVRVTPNTWPAPLSTTVFIVLPILATLSIWAIWLVVGGTFSRIDRIRREVAAITGGQSLHRRLSADQASPELTALIETLNTMIARLESSFAALRRFTADASHELKTPLAVLRADVERAMHENASRTERFVALEEALHETTRMSDLVESLLTLARADEGRLELHREPVDLHALTQEVYETALILGEAAGVSVNLPFTTEVTILGDRARLRQLFLNLVTNAIKYTPPGGRVDLGLGRHPGTVTFAVRDTGIGIAAADLPHIFERFWRADRVRSRTAERGGVGLGLAISQWIAQAHGGTLTASSRLGRGSLFTVTLPAENLTET